ncbi:MAG: sulfite exporter TauE/SafE family protein [Thermoleophilia bacterium]|nr:sulfite exporter TauE/SafE family protein [Thermoleophilia bacterium]
MAHVVYLALAGFLGGAFGSMVGLGGGIFIVPVLVLFLDVPIHSAVSASLLGVVATSTTGSIIYLRQGLVNLRLTVTIETALTVGALTGGIVGVMLDKEALSAIFGGLMLIVAVYVAWRRKATPAPPAEGARLGRLGSGYLDPSLHREVTYSVRRLPLGLVAGLVAGNVSGLLGVGGGWLTVPTLRLGMGVPMRAAVATSSLMLGVTACAGALVYLLEGLVDPATAVPVVLGVVTGAALGSRLASRVRTSVLAVILAVVLFVLAVEMILAAVGISLR